MVASKKLLYMAAWDPSAVETVHYKCMRLEFDVEKLTYKIHYM